MQQIQVENILQRLGLNESEIRVFLNGLKMGPSTVIQLAKQSKLQRITTHAIVERLLFKGIFLETKNKKKRLVYPNDIGSLQRLLEQKKQELDSVAKELKKAEPFLKNLQAWSEGFANVRFYKGKEGVELMINELVNDKEDMLVICDSRNFYDLIDNQFLERSLEVRKKYNLDTKMLFPMGFEHFCYTQGTYEQKLSIRSLPDTGVLIGALNIWGNKIGFHCEKNDFITTTIIEDEQIAGIMKYLFHNIWSNAKEY